MAAARRGRDARPAECGGDRAREQGDRWPGNVNTEHCRPGDQESAAGDPACPPPGPRSPGRRNHRRGGGRGTPAPHVMARGTPGGWRNTLRQALKAILSPAQGRGAASTAGSGLERKAAAPQDLCPRSPDVRRRGRAKMHWHTQHPDANTWAEGGHFITVLLPARPGPDVPARECCRAPGPLPPLARRQAQAPGVPPAGSGHQPEASLPGVRCRACPA